MQTLPPDSESDEASITRSLEMLARLAVLGMDFCEHIAASRTNPVPGTTTTRQETAEALAKAQTFGNIARTVRHTLALEQRLRDHRRARAAAAVTAAEAAAKAQLAARTRELQHRIKPAMQEASARHPDGHLKIRARLADWQTEQDLTHRSVDHAIARICRECAIPPPPGVTTNAHPP